MKIIPYTNNTLKLTTDNKVINANNIELPIAVEDNNVYITFDWIDGYKKYDLKLIYLSCFLDHYYPDYVFKHIEIFTKDNEKELSLDNLWFRFTQPILVRGSKDLYHIPYFSRYYISKSGKLFSILRKIVKKYHILYFKNDKKNRQGGYHRTRSINDLGKRTITGKHRLLLLAFKQYDKPIDKLYGNHIDGNPENNRLSNLEWVTPSGNLIHALNTGLMPNSTINVTVKNLKNNVVKEFSSINNAAKYLGWTHTKTQKRLHSKSIYPDQIIIKKKDDTWENINSLNVTRMGVRVKVSALINDEVIIFNSIMEASKYTNVNTTSISKAVRGTGKSVVKGILFTSVE